MIILLSVLAYYYRSELGAGFGYARSRMMPDTSAAGSRNAAYIIPWAKVKLIPFESGFELPVYLTNAGDGSGRIFVVEKEGRIKVIKGGETLEEPFLDIVARVRSKESERGLLSVAFHPRYEENGRFFVNYTDLEGDTIISEFHAGQDPDRADSAGERIILKIKQPARNHNGGQIQFGPDGYLYIAMGDGGFFGDPSGNGQNMD
ncbi:MAG: PQQ-dependent sugar dehydrogenase, partial [Thermodesulfobacteriota bacterium]